MKKIILILGLSVLSAPAFTCSTWIPESYVPTFLNPPVKGHYAKCEDRPEEKCHCVDSIDPYSSELVDNIVLSHTEKLGAVSCVKNFTPPEREVAIESNVRSEDTKSEYEDCDKKFEDLKCEEGSRAIKNYLELEVYCAKDIFKVEGKKLEVNHAKRSTHEEFLRIEKQMVELEQVKKDSAKTRIMQTDIDSIKDINELKTVIKDMVELLKK